VDYRIHHGIVGRPLGKGAGSPHRGLADGVYKLS
jgi:hypothetical protein